MKKLTLGGIILVVLCLSGYNPNKYMKAKFLKIMYDNNEILRVVTPKVYDIKEWSSKSNMGLDSIIIDNKNSVKQIIKLLNKYRSKDDTNKTERIQSQVYSIQLDTINIDVKYPVGVNNLYAKMMIVVGKCNSKYNDTLFMNYTNTPMLFNDKVIHFDKKIWEQVKNIIIEKDTSLVRLFDFSNK